MSAGESQPRKQEPVHAEVAVFDLTCGGGGALTVERALGRLAGVRRVYVNPLTEMAYIDYEPDVTTVAALIAAVEGCGYRALKVVETRGTRRPD